MLVQPYHDAPALRLRALVHAGERARGRCSTAATAARRAASSTTIQTTGYFLPPTRVDELRRGARAAAARRGAGARWSCRRLRARRRARPAAGAAPARRQRPAHGGARRRRTSPRSRARFDADARHRRAGPDAAHRARGPIDLRQRFWFNPTLADRNFFLAALAGMLLTNLCLSATSLGLVGERESGTYEQMLSLPTTPLEIVLGKLLPLRGDQLRRARVRDRCGAGVVFGLLAAGQLARARRRHAAVRARLARRSASSSRRSRATSAQAVFISVFFILPSFVLSGVMYAVPVHAARRARDRRAAVPLRWYQIALRRLIVARRRARRRDRSRAVALLVIFAVPAGPDPLADEAAARVSRRFPDLREPVLYGP